GIIYNPPQSPQHSVDSHRAINTNDIHLLLWSNMENLKDNSSSRLETRGLHKHGSVNVASLKAVGKFSAQNEELQFKIRFKRNLSLTKL
ncbi:hypothetical protein, partial [Escherichia coli]|uniref:hypothetical protein n=1 Tax=Escherichia coli TaxID=562 RepID=UPI002B2434E3